jgi:hypothetical protein
VWLTVVLGAVLAAPTAGDSGEDAAVLADDWIEREMAQVIERPRPLPGRRAREPIPAWLRAAPTDLQEAWASYRSIADALEKRLARAPKRERVGINQFNLPAARRPVIRFLRGERVDLVKEVSGMFWSNNRCGTGMEPFIEDQHRLVLMGVLRERNDAAAAAAAISYDARRRFSQRPLPMPRFLQALGLDWETLYAGAMLAEVSTSGPSMLPPDFTWRPLEQGSLRAARYLLEMSRLPEFDTTDQLVALALFVEAGPFRPTTDGRSEATVGAVIRGRNFWRDEPAYLGEQEQKEVLGRLAARVSPDTAHGDLEEVVETLSELRREEGREALRRALDLPNDRVRETAANGLRGMGESVPAVKALDVSTK